MRRLTENLGMIGYTAKPVLLCEFGAFRDRYATEDLADDAI
jgi:hypothetical protein